ncbi:MAG TPA: DUF2537 domain-containing protein [Pseudonocardiaceae bacterium]|nr:DUF2537 domain-containing protein [Pseudonocardiaceae bacterium]
MQLRARDGRALLAGEAGDLSGLGDDPAEAEVDPHSLALSADLADALHEWARVADAVYRNGQPGGSAAGRLISRRGRQLAARLAAVMGAPVSYADPLTGEVTEVEVPDEPADERGSATQWWSERNAARHRAAEEPPPWATGLTVSFVTAVLIMIVVVTLSLALGAANRWLPLIANVVIALGLAPSVWLARRARVWRWVAFGVVGGIVVAWIALLFTAI